MLLVASGSLKAYDAAAGGSAILILAMPLWAIIAIVEFEWAFGLWLIAGLHAQGTRKFAIACFAVFALISLSKSSQGESSCGCFGRIRVSPWLMFFLDVLAVALLVTFRPSSPRGVTNRSNPMAVAMILTICVWVGGAWAVVVNRLDLDRDRVVLQTESWAGKRLPVLDEIETTENLAKGTWTILLYHHDCKKCQDVIPKYDQRARDYNSLTSASRFALVEVPPFGNAAEDIIPKDTPCSRGRLPVSKEWIVTTPAEIQIQDGVVVAARTVAMIDEQFNPESRTR
jgi:hypothetical protein